MAFFRSHREEVEKSEFGSKPLDSKQNKITCLDQLSLCHCLRTQPREVDRTEFGFWALPIPRRVVPGKSLNFAGPQLLEAWADWLHIQKQLLLLCYSSFYPVCGILWPLACPSRALHIVTDTVRELLLGPDLHQSVEVSGTSREMACH